MICLITGASGFIGGRLAQVIAAKGGKVRILDRKGILPAKLATLDIEVVKGDLADEDALQAAVKGVSRIFNCAGCSTDWAPWKTFLDANVTGVGKILRAAESVPGLERFVHVSTTDTYGYPDIACDESGPLKDTGLPYNRSKILGEKLVWEAGKRRLPVTVVRPATIYGPGSKDAVAEISKLLKEGSMMYVSGGRSKGGFVYIDDLIEAMIDVSGSRAALGQAYNISPVGEDSTWREFVEALAMAMGAKKPRLSLPFGLAYSLGATCEFLNACLRLKSRPLISRHAVRLFAKDQNYPSSKAVRDFGFRPQVGLPEGIRRSVEWLESRK